MLLGFKRQFAPHVKNGSKRHTIRDRRKIRPQVGETCHCYVDPRQKTMELLGRWTCVRVQEITITANVNWLLGFGYTGPAPITIWLDDQLLSRDEAERFMWTDGFREKDGKPYPALRAAAKFWRKRLKAGRGTWTGDVIHWAYGRKGAAR